MPGHTFLPLARLVRAVGPGGTVFTTRVQDIRPAIQVRDAAMQFVTLPPMFWTPTGEGWNLDERGFAARKPGIRSALGMLPVVLPVGAVVEYLRCRGTNDCPTDAANPQNGRLEITLHRRLLAAAPLTDPETVASTSADAGAGDFDVEEDLGSGMPDTNHYTYFIKAKVVQSGGTGSEAVRISGFRIGYRLS